MKRFDPQVGGAGQGMSAGKHHLSLKRLLRNAGAISLFAAPVLVPTFLNAQAISLSTSGTYTQNFDTLANTGTTNTWTDNSTITGWYAQRSGSGTTYAADTGSGTTGTLYSYGASGSTDRALGSIGSGNAAAGSFAYGVVLQNTASSNLTFSSIAYDLEQWRLGATGKATNDTITFWYKISGTATTALTPTSSTGWTAVTALDAVAPVNTGTVGALVGNTNKTAVSSTTALNGITVSAGQYITFRWADPDHAGTDQGTAIDNFSLSYLITSTGGNYWVGGNGTWSSSSTNFSATSGGSTGAAQATTGAIVFDTASATPTVSGTVDVAAGLTFGANGITITSGTINLSGTSAATNAITVTNAGDAVTIGSVISGSNGLTMSGPGKLTLNGTNTLTGVVTLTGGTLRATAAGALGAGTLSIGGGTLELATNNGASFNRNTTVTANATIKSDSAAGNGTGATQTLGTLSIGAQTLIIDRGSNLISGTAGIAFGATALTGAPTFTVNTGSLLTLASVTGTAQNITVNGAGDTTVSGAIATTTGSITKSGNGILTLSGNNSFTGGLTINAGTVKLGSTAALNSTAGSQNSIVFGSGSTGTLSLNGNNATIASLSSNNNPGTPVVQNANASGATLTIGNSSNADSSFAGVIQDGTGSGTLGLTKEGTGTLTFSGTNTYTGGTTLNSGTLKLSGAGALAGGTVAISGGTLSSVNSAGVNNTGGSLSGTSNNVAGNINLNSGIIDLTAGSLSVGGDLTLLGGNIKYTLGKTLAVTGQLNLSSAVNVTLDGSYTAGAIYTLLSYSSSSPAPDFSNNFKINLLNNSLGKWTYDTNESSLGVYKITILSLASNLNWNLSGDGDWDKNTLTNWYNSKNSSTQAFTDGDNVTFDKSTGGIISIISTVTPGSVTVNTAVGGDYTFQTGSIAGDGGITKSGNGKLTLSHANTFAGEVVVNAGTLIIGDANALGGTTTGTRILSGATLELSSDITTLAAEPLTLVGTGVGGVGALTSQPGVHTVSGPITLSGDTLITSQGSAGPDTFTITGTISGSNYTLTVGGSASTNISGNLSGTGLALNKIDNGILTLSGSSNTYTGLTSVSSGTLVAQNATSISPTVSVASGATLSLQDNQTLTSLAGSGEVRIADGKTFTLNNSTTQTFGGTFTATSGTAFTKSGAGTLNLSGASTQLARDITLSAGTVKASNNKALGSGTVLIGTGGSGSTGTLFVAKDKTISNNITVGSSVKGTNSLLAGWDFQTTTNGGTAAAAAPNAPNKYVANFGTGTLYLDGTNGSSSWITATTGNEVASFAGNAGSGLFSTTTTGAATLSILGGATPFTANGKYMVFAVDMSNKLGLTISYDTRYSGTTGFTSQIWEYSTDGTNWSNAGTITVSSATFAAKSLAEISALNGDSTAFVRLSLTGATSATGNNRLDNIAFMALGADSTTGSGVLGIDEAGTATFTGNIVVNNTAELTAATGGTAIFNTGVISGLGSLTKTGDGTVVLQGANTFTGSLTLSAGNLKVSSLGAGGAASPLGAATDVPGSIIFKGGKLEYAGSGETLTRDFTVGNGGAGFISSGSRALNIGQDAQMDFESGTTSNRTLTLGGTTDIAVENIFNPTKIASADVTKLFTKLVKQDTNKWIVQGTGAGFVDAESTEMNIDGGELDFAMGSLGSSSHKAHINVGSATLGWYGTHTDDISGRIYLNNNSAAAAFNVPSGTVVTLNSAFNGGAATTASLMKLGNGTLQLGAANNFSGGLTVSAGTVKASFAGSVGSGAVNISNNATFVVNAILANKINVTSGGTLAGTGTDEDATIEEDGILSPNEDSIGTLSFNKLTLNGGAHVKWQLQNAAGAAGVGYDTLVVATLNLSNAISTKKKIVVEVTSAGPASGFDKTKLNKFEFAKITTDLANGLNVTDLFSIDASQFEIANNLINDHLVWSMQYSADRDMMYVTTMIPEPSTYGLGLSALALAVVAIRRRKKKKI